MVEKVNPGPSAEERRTVAATILAGIVVHHGLRPYDERRTPNLPAASISHHQNMVRDAVSLTDLLLEKLGERA